MLSTGRGSDANNSSGIRRGYVCYNAAISKRNGWTSITNSRICERKLQRSKKIVIFLLPQADKMLYYIKKVIKRDFKSK